jgi:hypothetical protein
MYYLEDEEKDSTVEIVVTAIRHYQSKNYLELWALGRGIPA